MQIINNNYSILEIQGLLDRRELIVNRDYQRGSGIWPNGPSSYFIDTILEGFPFPKIYMYEFIDRRERKARKELVDGQQRISAIQRFLNDEYSITGESRFNGLKFSELEEEDQDRFYQYSVPVDVVRNASRTEILQMFRRMNAYTLPLNDAEKRHSTYQGEFKWFVNSMADDLNEFFVEYGVFNNREIVRMSDSALITDLVLSLERGIISTSPSDLNNLYRSYDDSFPNSGEYRRKIHSAFEFISLNLTDLRRSFLMKPYALHSLVTALIHARYGIPEVTNALRVPSINSFAGDVQIASRQLLAIAQAHEAKELEGPFAAYISGTLSSTHRRPKRVARVSSILYALGVAIAPVHADDA